MAVVSRKLQKFLFRQELVAKHITVRVYRAVICWKLLWCCNTKHLLFVLSLFKILYEVLHP